jgi:hypothetical protein
VFTTQNSGFFFDILCLIQWKFLRCAIMSSTTENMENMPTTEPKRKSATRSAPRKKGGTRQPGRPHKRLTADVLSARTSVLAKKLQVLMAKKTLIAERLEAYEAENKLRQQEEEEKQQDA